MSVITQSLAYGLHKRYTNEYNRGLERLSLPPRAPAGAGLVRNFERGVRATFAAHGENGMSLKFTGKGKDRTGIYVIAQRLACGTIFMRSTLHLRTLMKDQQDESKYYVLPAMLSAHAIERAIQAGMVKPQDYLPELYQHALLATRTPELKATFRDNGTMFWEPDGEFFIGKTYIRSDRLDTWQRDYDRWREGLPVPGVLPREGT